MIRSRWHLPLLLGLLAVATPLAASDIQQVLFNFVKPMAVVGITLEDADLPSATAEATPEGDILRRVTFSPAQRPTLRMSPALGRWDWSAADYVSLRIQNAMSWDMTLEVAIEGEQGAPGLQASIELPAGPPQTLLVPLRAVSPEALGMRAGPPMPQMVEGQRVLLAQWQGLFGILLHCRGERGAADYLREALEQLPEDAWSQGLICRSALMQLAMIEGRMDQARLIGRDALRLAREHDSLIFEALIELERAQWLEQRGELLRAEGVLDRAQRYLEDLGQQGSPMLGRIALRRARLCLQQGREVEAGHWYRLGLEQARENLDPWALYGYLGLALLEAGQGDLDAAFNRLLEVERLMQQRHVPDPLYRGALLLVSSALTLQQGRPAQAREILLRVRAYFQPGRARLSPPSEPELEARVEHQLALAELYSGEAAAAEARLRGLLAILEAQGRQTLLCEVRMGIAECQFLSGQLPQAQQTLRSGLELAERLGLQLPQRRLRDRQPQLFAALPGEEEEGLSPLSCRELAVLGLIAQGCSNQEIGEQLFISLHTVKTHARRINGKLGVARRTQAVARAKALGLLA